MTKNDFITIFKKVIDGKKNFSISTNVAVGLGLNGVDYKEFSGLHFWVDRGCTPKYYCSQTRVAGFVGDCVVLETYKSWKAGDYEHSSLKATTFIPISNVLSVSVWDVDKREENDFLKWGLHKVEFEHSLKED